MKHIKSHDDYAEYGVLYAKVVFPKGHYLSVYKHHHIPSMLPDNLLSEISDLAEYINTKFSDNIIVPMDVMIMPGCVSTPDYIEIIANEIYNGMLGIFKKLFNEDNCILLAWGIGSMPKYEIENKVKTTHEIGYYPIMLKLGRTFDSLDKEYKTGIFKIEL